MLNLLKKLILSLIQTKNKEDWVTTLDKPVKLERKLNIDWNFIAQLEGFETVGYVPKEENANNNRVVSGVTIASGFDLGQHSVEYLYRLDFPVELKNKLVPYMGLKGQEAKDKLKEIPLILTEEEALEVNRLVKNNKSPY